MGNTAGGTKPKAGSRMYFPPGPSTHVCDGLAYAPHVSTQRSHSCRQTCTVKVFDMLGGRNPGLLLFCSESTPRCPNPEPFLPFSHPCTSRYLLVSCFYTTSEFIPLSCEFWCLRETFPDLLETPGSSTHGGRLSPNPFSTSRAEPHPHTHHP